MGIRVGIDLGTTYCAVAGIGPDGRPQIIHNTFGDATTPSVVCFDDGEELFGREAKDAQSTGAPDAFTSFKRSMGDPYFSVQVDGTSYTATDFSAGLLKFLVSEAEEVSEQKIDAAVVTVPAYFQNAQREATKEACKKAGLKLISLLNEPSAAAYAYGLNGSDNKTVMIYDLGGGTFDVTISRITKDKVRVLAVEGDHQLGGKDWDMALVDLMLDSFCEQTGIDKDDLDLSMEDRNMLEVRAEVLKRQLSAKPRVSTKLRLCGMREDVTVTRSDFEACTDFLVRRTEDYCQKALDGAKLAWRNVDEVVLVGGSTRMPMIPAFVERMVGRPPLHGINPDEAVAMGAAIFANLPEEGAGSQPTFTLGGVKPKLSLVGAKHLDDCTGYALGIIAESSDRTRYINSTIIPKNAPVPAEGTHDYAIRVSDKGGELEAYVLQGQEERPLDNVVAGKYVVKGIKQEGSGESLVRVTYSYAQDSTIHVTATQPHFGRNLEVVRAEVEDDLSRFDGNPQEKLLAQQKAMANYPIMLCLDVSASMYGEGFRATVPAVESLLATLEGTFVPVGLMFFSVKNYLVMDPTVDYESILEAVRSLREMKYPYNGFNEYCRIVRKIGTGTIAEPVEWYSTYRRRTYNVAFRQVKAGAAKAKTSGGGLFGHMRNMLDGNSGVTSVTRSSADTVGARSMLASGNSDAFTPPEAETPLHDTLFIITDGIWEKQSFAINNAKRLAREGAEIVAVGVADADEGFLRMIATRSDFAAKTSFAGMGEVFSTIGREIASQSSGAA